MEQQADSSKTNNPKDNNHGVNKSNLSTPAANDSMTQNETPNDDVHELESVGRKRRQRSVVWNHFKKMKVNGIEKAECKYCKKKLGGSSKNGTRHLHDHFKVCIRRPFQDIRQHILVGERKKVDGSSSYLSNYTFNADNSRRDLAEMIIIHEYPLSIVEHHGFRKFVGNLQPLFKVRCRNTIKGDIMSIYDFEKQKTLKLLDKNTSRVAVTTDMWTASNQKKGFMVITAHFIDQNWNMQSRIMRFIYVPCPHTSDVLADVLYDSLCDWNLDRKLSTITVDNCTTNDLIINILLEKLPLSSLIQKGRLFHMRCCAHILNLIVQDGLDIIRDEIERIRDSVAFWTATPKRQQRFEETTHNLEIPFAKKLSLDCKTRWNSTFLMLSAAIAYKEVFKKLKQRESQYKCLPSEHDWELAKEICDRLQLFYEVTVMFSGTKYPTTNVFFPYICEIRYSLVDWACSSNEVIKQMATKMLQKFDKYWSVIHGIMGMAAVLDPRYKLKFVELLFPVLYGKEKSESEIEKLKELVYSLFQEYESSSPSTRTSYEGVGCSSFTSGPSVGHRVEFKKLFSSIASIASQHDDTGITTELDNYLKEKLLPKDVDLDLLAWWKTNGFKYPTLQRIAKDILAIPISTVASESAFSTGGRLVSPHRSRLHAKTLEALMCAQSWLLNEIRETCSGESEAYCRTVEYDYDVEEENKESEI
ncbi:zinc finger BED domain-containing protein RICESLEEPER 3-like [Lactuca sativa]|nr:zinc finger BED domain-containing protein RICESLEEPER 3-like [Lactuca sativa]